MGGKQRWTLFEEAALRKGVEKCVPCQRSSTPQLFCPASDSSVSGPGPTWSGPLIFACRS